MEADEHNTGDKGSMLIRRKWKKEGKEREERRIRLHIMALACRAFAHTHSQAAVAKATQAKQEERAEPIAPLFPCCVQRHKCPECTLRKEY